MELENRLPIAARIDIAGREPSGARRGLFLAKVTYRFDSRGGVSLDEEDPKPLLFGDGATPLGDLPRDDVPRIDDAFEVFLLGSARAPGGRATRQMNVSLRVGDVRRELVVSGDRHWLGDDETATISEAEPFVAMPVSWERAFGGTAEVEIDEESFVEVRDDRNDRGRGFDVAPHAEQLARALGCPPGYPRFPNRRPLPNVEIPTARVARWTDAPDAEAWAPRGPGWALSQELARDPQKLARRDRLEPSGSDVEPYTERIHHRAHPGWVLPTLPTSPAQVELDGFSPAGQVKFIMPSDRVGIEYVVGARTGTRWATPHTLLLLPDEERFVLVHRLRFVITPPAGEPRRAVVRMEQRIS